jgi:MFS family permease
MGPHGLRPGLWRDLLVGGRLGDLYGRRRLLIWGMALFAGGSVLAGVAPALVALVAARVLQGLGAAAAVPAGLALIGSLFRRDRHAPARGGPAPNSST